MKQEILVMGGSRFVSYQIAKYFSDLNEDVYVLNRGNSNDLPRLNVTYLKADRHDLKQLQSVLNNLCFDTIIDVSCYQESDVDLLLKSLTQMPKCYILMSSSAIYQVSNGLLSENSPTGFNPHWQDYGLNKLAAEQRLLKEKGFKTYCIRPPYIYGQMNNLYREAFIFDRLLKHEEIYIFNDGKMKLHFIDILDVCQFIHTLIQLQPSNSVYNIGHEVVSVKEWIEQCEKIVGQKARLVNVDYHLLQLNPKSFFPFRDYEYILDTTCQDKIYQCSVSLEEGLQKGYDYYLKYDGITEDKNKYMFLK